MGSGWENLKIQLALKGLIRWLTRLLWKKPDNVNDKIMFLINKIKKKQQL